MKLEDTTTADFAEAFEWAQDKAEHYVLPIEDLQSASYLKVDGVFYCVAKPVLLLGPLIPKPGVDGRKLGLALHRMIKDVRKTFSGDIIYLTRGPDGVDELAVAEGFERESAQVMRLRGSHGL